MLPTPVIGVVGLIEDAGKVRARVFPEAGLDVVLFGENLGELGGSEWLATIHGRVSGRPPALDLGRERALQGLLVELSAGDRIRSAHDCAEGGVAVALAECCFESGGIGVDVSLEGAPSADGLDPIAATLFGESASRAVVSVEPAALAAVLEAASAAGVPAARIGRTGGDAIRIAVAGRVVIDCALHQAEASWGESLATELGGRVA